MWVNHKVIFTDNLEALKDFYLKYFDGQVRSHTEDNDTSTYFLTFKEGMRLELMNQVHLHSSDHNQVMMKVGNIFRVLKVTEHLKKDGYQVIKKPAAIGKGLVESLVLDPDGNCIEIIN